LWRVHSADTSAESVPPKDNIMCVSRNRATALAERYLANLAFGSTGDRVIERGSPRGEALSAVVTTADLTLAWLSVPPALPVRFDWAQGALWPSMLDVPRRTMALFPDRCPDGVLETMSETTTRLDDAEGAALLTEVLDPYRVRVPPPDDLLAFINYRSGDEKHVALLLDKALRARLGDSAVFLDRRSIELGTDFAEKLMVSVRGCKVLVSVIGPRWEEFYDQDGRRAIERADDWVRREIVEALRHGIKIVPVIVGRRPGLRKEILPEEVHPIVNLQAAYLSDAYTEEHVAEVVDKLIAEIPVLRRAAC